MAYTLTQKEIEELIIAIIIEVFVEYNLENSPYDEPNLGGFTITEIEEFIGVLIIIESLILVESLQLDSTATTDITYDSYYA